MSTNPFSNERDMDADFVNLVIKLKLMHNV